MRHTRRLSERGATRSLNRHENTSAIYNLDKLTIASTHNGNRTSLRISNAIRFNSVAFHALVIFDVIAVTLSPTLSVK